VHKSDTAAYMLARLKRDRPDLAERVSSGTLSVNRAAIEAGFRRHKAILAALADHPRVGEPPCVGCSFAGHCGEYRLACKAFCQYAHTGRWHIPPAERVPDAATYLGLFEIMPKEPRRRPPVRRRAKGQWQAEVCARREARIRRLQAYLL